MPKTGLSISEFKTQIILKAEEKIRTLGFNRFTLADLARDLNVSHAALYRYVPSKEALLDAVSQKWLERIDVALEQVVHRSAEPVELIIEWFIRYYSLKREKVRNDPEIYKSFNMAVEAEKPFVKSHLDELKRQLTILTRRAAKQGFLNNLPVEKTVLVLLSGTAEFHHPRLVAEHRTADRTSDLETVLQILIMGLSTQQK